MLRREFIYGCIILLFSIIVLILIPFQISNMAHAGKGQYITVTPATFPLLTTILILVLSVIFLLGLYKKKKAGVSEGANEVEKMQILPVIIIVCSALLYTFLLNILGFLIDSILFCTFVTLYYRGRLWQVLISGIIAPVTIYYLFRLLYVPLPKGFWV